MSESMKRLKVAGQNFVAEVEAMNQERLDYDEIQEHAQRISEDLAAEGIPVRTTRDYLLNLLAEGLDQEFKQSEGA